MPVLEPTSISIVPSFVQERFPVLFGMEMKELRIRPASRTVKGQAFGEPAPIVNTTRRHGALSAHEPGKALMLVRLPEHSCATAWCASSTLRTSSQCVVSMRLCDSARRAS